MSAHDPARRCSQWDAPIPITSFDELENRARRVPSYKPSQDSLQSQISHSPSLVSPLCVSPPTRHPHITQPAWSEKEVVSSEEEEEEEVLHQTISRPSTSYSLISSPAYPPGVDTTLADSGFGQPLAYHQSLAYNQALGTTTSNPDMNIFRRNPSKALRRGNETQISQQTPEPSRASITNEKLSLGPQDTGVVHEDGEVGFGYGVQDEEKQSLSTHPSSITAQIAEARSTRIRAVVDAYVEPLLREQAANGLARSTFVLVPEVAVNPDSVHDYSGADDPLGLKSSDELGGKSDKDVKKLPSDTCRLLSKQEAFDLLIGFPAETSLHVVRLSPAHSGHTGHAGTARDRLGDSGSRFWQQPAAVAELDRLLRIRLVGMGLDVHDASGATAPFRRPGWTERGEMVGGSPGLPAAADAAAAREKGRQKKWSGDHWDAGVGIWTESGKAREKSSWQKAKEHDLLPGQASVKVELQEVSFRTVSPMGLYETRLDQAVVVTVVIEV